MNKTGVIMKKNLIFIIFLANMPFVSGKIPIFAA